MIEYVCIHENRGEKAKKNRFARSGEKLVKQECGKNLRRIRITIGSQNLTAVHAIAMVCIQHLIQKQDIRYIMKRE